MDGQPVRLRGPRDAIAQGIGMVHQHFMLVPTLTRGGERGARPRALALRAGSTRRAPSRRSLPRASASASSWIPRARVDTLTVGSQQKVEIVKALHRGAQVLILDEPTAVLTPQEADELFRVARGLAAGGRTVVFISHKLREVLGVADRVVVMRRGRHVAEVRAADTRPEQLAALMVGESRAAPATAQDNPQPPGRGAAGDARAARAGLGWTARHPGRVPRGAGGGNRRHRGRGRQRPARARRGAHRPAPTRLGRRHAAGQTAWRG